MNALLESVWLGGDKKAPCLHASRHSVELLLPPLPQVIVVGLREALRKEGLPLPLQQGQLSCQHTREVGRHVAARLDRQAGLLQHSRILIDSEQKVLSVGDVAAEFLCPCVGRPPAAVVGDNDPAARLEPLAEPPEERQLGLDVQDGVAAVDDVHTAGRQFERHDVGLAELQLPTWGAFVALLCDVDTRGCEVDAQDVGAVGLVDEAVTAPNPATDVEDTLSGFELHVLGDLPGRLETACRDETTAKNGLILQHASS
mmetsp:Transcript_26580/g.66088  ORF Transcript_26580/g.66088 Transcript_26580/m.66088 type:complete len:257 (+) Transcript_26580:731-1501(+)